MWGVLITTEPQWAGAAGSSFEGKTIKIIVGFTSGGFYDRWSRLLARHMPKYLPGSPEMVVQNMPGAGGLIAANHIYSVAKPDGLTIAMLSYGLYLDQLVGRKEVQYDVRKLHWIGSPEKSDVLMYMRSDAPYKSIEDIRKATTPPKCGSTGTAGTDYIFARLLEETLDAKIETVMGYLGGSEIDLAVEKGEVQCRGLTAAPFFGHEPFISWRKRNFVNVLLYGGLKRDSRIPDTPTIYEIFDQEKTPEESRRVADVIPPRRRFWPAMGVAAANSYRNRQDYARRPTTRRWQIQCCWRKPRRANWKSSSSLVKSCKSSPRPCSAIRPSVVARVKKLLATK